MKKNVCKSSKIFFILTLVSYFFIGIPTEVFAEESTGYLAESPLVLEGDWLQEYDFKLDGSLVQAERTNKLRISVEDNSNFVARYLNLKMREVYRGTIYSARSNSIINMIFTSKDYFGCWTGKMTSDREIIGTWFDVAKNSGDFRLYRVVEK